MTRYAVVSALALVAYLIALAVLCGILSGCAEPAVYVRAPVPERLTRTERHDDAYNVPLLFRYTTPPPYMYDKNRELRCTNPLSRSR